MVIGMKQRIRTRTVNITILRYGLYYGLCLGAGFYLSYLLLGTSSDNYGKSEVVGYSVMVFSSITIYLAMKHYRDNVNEGYLNFTGGLKIGLGMSVIGGLAFALYNWLYLNFIHPTFMDEYYVFHSEQIRNSGESEAAIEQQLLELTKAQEMMLDGGFLPIMFLTVFFIGTLFTLVTAAALKTPGPSH